MPSASQGAGKWQFGNRSVLLFHLTWYCRANWSFFLSSWCLNESFWTLAVVSAYRNSLGTTQLRIGVQLPCIGGAHGQFFSKKFYDGTSRHSYPNKRDAGRNYDQQPSKSSTNYWLFVGRPSSPCLLGRNSRVVREYQDPACSVLTSLLPEVLSS